jgi:CHRD domain-containing protein/PEP-CTERM motif-containing protein
MAVLNKGDAAVKSLIMLALLTIVLVGASQISYADTIVLTANLSGPAEAPPNASPGIGSTIVTINTLAHTLRVQVTFSGLIGTTTASHIHSATAVPFAGTAGVATTTPTFAGFPLGVTSGTYDNTLDLTLASSYNPAFVTANGGTTATAEAALIAGILDGRAYLNVHSSAFPGGEIRGFLITPEPTTMFLLGTGLAGVALKIRGRRKSIKSEKA